MTTQSIFSTLTPEAPDSLLALIGLHAADERPDKIDVGVGVYRDAQGRTPIFASVKAAERILVAEQTSKSYLGPEGDKRFVELLAGIALGNTLAASPTLIGLQTPGGTGALRIGAELLERATPGRAIWVGTPTWANHIPIFTGAGLIVRQHRYFNRATSDIDFEGMLEDLVGASAGDILLMHGCCHNPTGLSFSLEQWSALADLVALRGLTPFIDLAYQGLGADLAEDVLGMKWFLARVPDALIAYSCDKNFGLYRERVGALWVQTPNAAAAKAVRSTVHALARVNWSMPPDHGAAIVRTILDDSDLRQDWETELSIMSHRIGVLRRSLAAQHPRLAPIGRQQGMFAMLPLRPEAVAELREQHAIYMAGNGRINIAGLQDQTLASFAEALFPHFGE